jgi:hypothetical protein
MGQRFSDIRATRPAPLPPAKSVVFAGGAQPGARSRPRSVTLGVSQARQAAGYSSSRSANSRLQIAQVITNRPHAITSKLSSVSPETAVCAR